MALEDLSGRQFTRLTVSGRGPNTAQGGARWWCLCTCGVRKLIRAVCLTHEQTRSCGCLRRETTAVTGQAARTHGHRAGGTSVEYKAWRSMKDRCLNSACPEFKDYGARGIEVCARWQGPHGFENFLKDMGSRPPAPLGTNKKRFYSIDRKDNQQGYTPDNCRWATYTQQNRNRRSNHVLTYEGRSLTITEWAAEVGMSKVTLGWRVRRGWPLSDALVPPR